MNIHPIAYLCVLSMHNEAYVPFLQLPSQPHGQLCQRRQERDIRRISVGRFLGGRSRAVSELVLRPSKLPRTLNQAVKGSLACPSLWRSPWEGFEPLWTKFTLLRPLGVNFSPRDRGCVGERCSELLNFLIHLLADIVPPTV